MAVYNALSVGERESRNGSLLFELYTLNQEMGAKDYIRQGALVYEAAQKVGYTNINYFHIKFKKYTGVAPGSLKK